MNKVSFLKQIITLLLLLLSVNTIAQNKITESFIDSVVNHAITTTPQAGIAVAVIQNGKVVHAKGYGVKSIKTNEKVDKNTLFSIASNSKAFTATALGILVDEGKIKWTDKVRKYIPEFTLNDNYISENFTIVDLLSHRSGMALGAGDLLFVPDGNDYTIDDVLNSFQYQKKLTPFRTKYAYNNMLYLVAGEVVKRVSGMSWGEFIEEKIFTPLGMYHSAPNYADLPKIVNLAAPHTNRYGELIAITPYRDKNRLSSAAAGIYSSVNDLTKWMLMHLNEGVYGEDLNDTLISTKNHNQLWTPHTNVYYDATPDNVYNQHYVAYGLGFYLRDQNGYTLVNHTGGMPGMLSQIQMIPELKSGVVVLTNTDPGGHGFVSITNTIKDALIGVAPQNWVEKRVESIKKTEQESKDAADEVWNNIKPISESCMSTDDIIGLYKDNWLGEVEIYENDDKLWFKSKRSPNLTGEMFYYKGTTFAIKWNFRDMDSDAFATFVLDEKGKAKKIIMKGISPNIDFSYDYHDLNLKKID